jgi:carboxymethylenebutenolidase
MCDNDTFDDMLSYERQARTLSRRGFGAMAAGMGVTFALPRLANAADVSESDVQIKTADGTADAYFVHPSKGAHPGVLIWPDIYGLRPAFRQMGKRLAESGYSVLVVNPFYRVKKAPVAAPGATMDDPATRTALMALAGALNANTAATDAKAFVTFLDSQAAVDKKRKLGTTGYCMGGPLTMRTAAAFPDRVGAGASFHGANLVNDKPESPHLLVPKLKAQYLFAIAENDDQRQPDAKNVLREAFAKASTPAEIEVYAGALHGWCPPDSKVYNEAQAEKAWSRLLALFEKGLA